MITNKHTTRIYTVRFLKLAIIVSTFLIVGLSPFSANAFDILFGTGKTGTFSHFTGRTICRVIDKHSDNISCKAVTTSDDVQNLTNLREGGLDIALIDSRMLFDAINKTGNFKFFDIGYENLRVLIPLYDVPITLVVRNDAKIASLEDLKGKRINAGKPRSLQHLAVDTIMQAKKWTKADFSLVGEISASLSQDTMAFCQGTIQAMVHIGVHPDASLQQLIELCNADLVGMDVLGHVAKNTYDLVPDDEARDIFLAPDYLRRMVEEGLLERVELAVDRDALHRTHLGAIGLHCQHQAGVHRVPVDEDDLEILLEFDQFIFADRANVHIPGVGLERPAAFDARCFHSFNDLVLVY